MARSLCQRPRRVREWRQCPDARRRVDPAGNTALAFPTLGGHDSDLSLIVTQVFSERTSLSVGKFNMLDAAAKTPLIGGGGLTTFMNTGLAAPISGVTPPYIIGGILTHKTDPATFTLMVHDPAECPGQRNPEAPLQGWGYDQPVHHRPCRDRGKARVSRVCAVCTAPLMAPISAIFPTSSCRPPARTSAPSMDTGSRHTRSSNISSKTNRTLPGAGVCSVNSRSSDGNPNPFGWSAFIGLGGSSLFPDRPDDAFGIAYFYYGFSDDLLDGLEELGYDYSDESGIEVFYSYAATPWLNLTGDAQVIWPGAGDEAAVLSGTQSPIQDLLKDSAQIARPFRQTIEANSSSSLCIPIKSANSRLLSKLTTFNSRRSRETRN